MMQINWDNLKLAKKLIGKKALLMGGGGIANEFTVVRILRVNEKTGQVEVDKGKRTANPYMCSWYIRPIRKDLEDLELGEYFLCGNGEIRKNDCGLFGTIYNCTLVKKIDINRSEK